MLSGQADTQPIGMLSACGVARLDPYVDGGRGEPSGRALGQDALMDIQRYDLGRMAA